ncbi:MAG: acyl-CoA dehydrogenase family protein [Myxococcales bacterium]|nr:acyl-CoA dehydrogenase family protein [Myxococcales bacterium]MCB9520268.1 acyl-CoA dehydrogenase family protein [Myxococcales bacterium]MCB9531364.1 acyl-CoA dehydrogenase family protein [Myxococcales bacterium]MCB9533563.1 acyl-CoA dehydrogenase family protein [Myxococcales bacterium]
MGNFFRDNDDLRFYFERWFDWDPIVRLTEVDYAMEGGFASLEEAREFYGDIVEMVGEFAADAIAPKWEQIERQHIELKDGEVVFPPVLSGIFDELASLGVHGLCVPRELGGMNAPLLVYMTNAEMFARADVGVMTHISFHCGIAMAMLVYSAKEGTTKIDAESRAFISTRFEEPIREIVEGRAWGSMDITEPDAGSDMAALRTRAVQDADGNWRITGQKIFITSGNAKYHIVIARSEPGDLGLDGLSLFLVKLYDEAPDGTKTWHGTISRVEEKLGHKSSPTCAIDFEDTPAHLLGRRGEGFRGMLLLMNNARIGVAFEAIGIAEAAYRLAKDYAVQRRSMGKTIDRHEMIAEALREMRTDIQALRAVTMHATYYEELAQKTSIALELGYTSDPDRVAQMTRDLKRYKWEARRVTPLIKYFGGEKAVEIARRGVQIHGGVGYTKDYQAEKLLRDAMVLPIYEGTSQIQSLMAMKDTLMGIIADPAGFAKRLAKTQWRALSAKDPLERRAANVELTALKAQSWLLSRTAAAKVGSVARRPPSDWAGELKKEWDPKRDFSLAMLHAERLTRLLFDAAACELLWGQSARFPERREVLERWLERAEPRSRAMYDELTTTGAALLAELERAEA